MSVLTDRAELDAAIAEAELDDETAGRLRELVDEGKSIAEALETLESERGGADESPPPASSSSSEPTKQQLRALDRAMADNEKRVRAAMGDHVAGFVACETCGGVGLTPPGEPQPTPKHHPFFVKCETCDGFGQVLTGSIREGKTGRDCPACRGDGYLEALDESGNPRAGIPGVAPVSPPIVSPPTADNVGTLPPAAPAPEQFGKPAWMGTG